MKNYLSLGLFTFLIAISNQSFSQSCENGKDPFSGESTQIFDYKKHTIYYENKSSNYKLELNLDYNGELNVRIPAGAEIQIKFDNGDILKLNTVIEATPKSQVFASGYGASVMTKYAYIFKLDETSLNKLATSKADLIRYPDAKGGYIDYEVKGARGAKYVNTLQKGAKCMLENK
jgi:hypothetical protein